MEKNPILQDWEARISGISAEFQAAFGSLSQEQLEAKPSAEVWSIAENLQHLIRLNETYFPLFEQLKNHELKTPWLGRKLSGFFGTLIKKSVEPSREKKIKTFAIWQPQAQEREGSSLAAFMSHQERLALELESLGPLIDENPVLHSPANRNICYTLQQAVDIMLTHEERHLNQAKGLLDS